MVEYSTTRVSDSSSHLDAEFRLAQATDWRDYGGKPPETVNVFLEWIVEPPPGHPVPWVQAGRFATANLGLQDVLNLTGARVALAEPIAPPRRVAPRIEPRVKAQTPAGPKRASEGPGGTLLGVIDDGCPFAHAALRRADGLGTRVVALWDQNPAQAVSQARMARYGAEWGQTDLDGLIDANRSANGHVDEAACYRQAGLTSLAFRWTHGSHVTGRLAGNVHWEGGRVPTGRRGGAVGAGDRAATSDVAFVQLPREALLTVSPAAVAFHAFNGVDYLIRLAKEMGYKRLVVALAYENWLGPHDSNSWFERALDQLILDANRSQEPFQVRVVLAAGNSARQYGHLSFTREDVVSDQVAPTKTPPIHFYLAPDTEVPTWVELWLPKAWFASRLGLQLRAPGGLTLAKRAPLDADGSWTLDDGQAVLSVYGPVPDVNVEPGLRRRVLLRFAPTKSPQGHVRAPHGLWTLRVHSERPVDGSDSARNLKAHAYAVRGGGLMNQASLSRQSRFVVDSDKKRTLSGLAGGKEVLVAGSKYPDVFAYLGKLPARYGMAEECIAPGRPTDYSGAPDESKRPLVDLLAVTEDGLSLPGQLGSGTRSAGVYRMTGTSVAVPSAARWLADQSIWGPSAGKAPAKGRLRGPFPLPPVEDVRRASKAKRPRRPKPGAGKPRGAAHL